MLFSGGATQPHKVWDGLVTLGRSHWRCIWRLSSESVHGHDWTGGGLQRKVRDTNRKFMHEAARFADGQLHVCSWSLTLVTLAALPFMVFAQMMQSAQSFGGAHKVNMGLLQITKPLKHTLEGWTRRGRLCENTYAIPFIRCRSTVRLHKRTKSLLRQFLQFELCRRIHCRQKRLSCSNRCASSSWAHIPLLACKPTS